MLKLNERRVTVEIVILWWDNCRSLWIFFVLRVAQALLIKCDLRLW